jgi:hypothetical protein
MQQMSYKTKEEIRSDIEFHRAAKAKLQEAYLAIAGGGVQSYSIGSRSLTKHDLGQINKEIAGHDKAISELSAALNGRARRRAVGIVPRDW